jgi:oxygen-independent coproporphyrinogen-3 oxidase
MDGRQGWHVTPRPEPLGLYLHIPFCTAICHYCNFARGLFDPAIKDRYVAAIEREIRSACDVGPRAPADTIYFGGGTPSLLEPCDVERLIVACAESFDVAPTAEVTLEANPETATIERFVGFRAAGVNRISFGVQSFDDVELRRLGRLHTSRRATEAVGVARSAGLQNVSLDLMLGLPEQTVAGWLASVDTAIALSPDHLSLYILELYPGAPLGVEMTRHRWSPAADDDTADMYLEGLARLDAAGYEQYEISNVAKPGRHSRHNLKYWTDGEWLGFGCAAHSTRGGARWWNITGTDEYLTRDAGGLPSIAGRRVLSVAERLEDALVTGLRLSAGVDLEALGARYGVDVWGRYGSALASAVEAGLVERRERRVRLSRAGMLVANEILAVFV